MTHYTPRPRWVTVSAAVALLLVVAVVVLLLTGRGGEHSPGRHSPGGSGSHTQP